MAKTRRVKLNARPITMFGNHVKPVVLNQGARDKIKGVRTRKRPDGSVPPTMRTNAENARETTVGMVLTGVNKGRVYPYRSAKRGGAVPEKLSLVQRAGRKMKRVMVGGAAV